MREARGRVPVTRPTTTYCHPNASLSPTSHVVDSEDGPAGSPECQDLDVIEEAFRYPF